MTDKKTLVSAKTIDLFPETLPDGDEFDVTFMHRSFCLSGLPLRPLYKREDTPPQRGTLPAPVGRRKELSRFHRVGSTCSLSIDALPVTLPGTGQEIEVGVPWGAKARLLMMWLTSQARSPSCENRWLEIGSIRSWLAEVGVPYHPDSIAGVKEQLIRLSFAIFTMALKKDSLMYFEKDSLFDGAIFEGSDLESYARGDIQDVRFPVGLRLSEKAYNRFTGKDAIPIPTQVLSKISNNAMALDLVLYLSYRLPMLSPSESSLVSWSTLIAQFGNGEAKSKFRQVFDNSISLALRAFEAAKVDVTEEGLVLHHSDPAEWRRMFAVRLPDGAKSTSNPRKPRLANRIAPVQTAMDF